MKLKAGVNFMPFIGYLLVCAGCGEQAQNQYTDSRDGQTYPYVVLKNGTKWMTQNMNFDAKHSAYGDGDELHQDGRFYSWEGLKKACPSGWYVPNKLEWQYFIEQYGCCNGSGEAENALIKDENIGKIDFSQKSDGSYRTKGFWTSSQDEPDKAWSYTFVEDDKGFYWYTASRNPINDARPLARCRCIERKKADANAMPFVSPSEKDPLKGLLTDLRDGQLYPYKVMQDGKKWMTKNLNYEMADAHCYDNNCAYGEELGRLYSWNAALQACPGGWHLPSEEEWIALAKAYGGGYRDFNTEQYIGDAALTFDALTEGGEEGFNPKYGGFRDVYDGNTEFKLMFKVAAYWSSSASTENRDQAWNFQFGNVTNFRRNDSSVRMGLSCRCVED